MAVNRMRNALGAGARKGETFELRAGLVYVQIAKLLVTSDD